MMVLEADDQISATLMEGDLQLVNEAMDDVLEDYLPKPQLESKINSQNLTATSFDEAEEGNRTEEVHEMLKMEKKQLDRMVKRRAQDKVHTVSWSCRGTIQETDHGASSECGMTEEEIEDFLHSRVKRGRGGVRSMLQMTQSQSVMSISYSKLGATIKRDQRLGCSTRNDDHSVDNFGMTNREVEDLPHSRVKRGRGAVRPRMACDILSTSSPKSCASRSRSNGSIRDDGMADFRTKKHVHPRLNLNKAVLSNAVEAWRLGVLSPESHPC